MVRPRSGDPEPRICGGRRTRSTNAPRAASQNARYPNGRSGEMQGKAEPIARLLVPGHHPDERVVRDEAGDVAAARGAVERQGDALVALGDQVRGSLRHRHDEVGPLITGHHACVARDASRDGHPGLEKARVRRRYPRLQSRVEAHTHESAAPPGKLEACTGEKKPLVRIVRLRPPEDHAIGVAHRRGVSAQDDEARRRVGERNGRQRESHRVETPRDDDSLWRGEHRGGDLDRPGVSCAKKPRHRVAREHRRIAAGGAEPRHCRSVQKHPASGDRSVDLHPHQRIRGRTQAHANAFLGTQHESRRWSNARRVHHERTVGRERRAHRR